MDVTPVDMDLTCVSHYSPTHGIKVGIINVFILYKNYILVKPSQNIVTKICLYCVLADDSAHIQCHYCHFEACVHPTLRLCFGRESLNMLVSSVNRSKIFP